MKKLYADLAEYINQYLGLWDFFGVIRVVKGGETLFEKNYGYACLEHGIKNKMTTRFSLASMTKQFTAFAIMILVDQKRLELDQPANLYLPADLQISGEITVRHLLSHTSGLHNFYNFEDDFFGEYNRLAYSKSEFFEKYIKKEPAQKPGAYNYNNSNYNLLAWIIDNLSGMTYEQYLKTYIFDPLQIKNTCVDDGEKVIEGGSFQYLKSFDNYIRCPYYNEKFSIGAGAVVSTCDDLYKWYFCLRNRKILSKAAYEQFFTENLNHYCFGLEHWAAYGTDKYCHGGDHLAIATYIQNFFDEDLCILILGNNESINQYRLGNNIADILHGIEVDVPAKFEEIPLSQTELEKYCGTYLKGKIEIRLANGKLYFVRFKGSLYIELYPVGKDQFARRYCDQTNPKIVPYDEQGRPQFYGYSKID